MAKNRVRLLAAVLLFLGVLCRATPSRAQGAVAGAAIEFLAGQIQNDDEWVYAYEPLFPKSLLKTAIRYPDSNDFSAAPVAALSKLGCLVLFNSTQCNYTNVKSIMITRWTPTPVLIVLRDHTNDVFFLNPETGYPMGVYKLPENVEWDTVATEPCAGSNFFVATATHLKTETRTFTKFQKTYLFFFNVTWPGKVVLDSVDFSGIARARSVACLPQNVLAVAPRNRNYFDATYSTEATTLYISNMSVIRAAGAEFRETAVPTPKSVWTRAWTPVFWKNRIVDFKARIAAKSSLQSICVSVDTTATVDDTTATWVAALTRSGAIMVWNTTSVDNMKEFLNEAYILPTLAVLEREDDELNLSVYVKNVGIYAAPIECSSLGISAMNVAMDTYTTWYWNGSSVSIDVNDIDLAVLPHMVQNYVLRTKEYIRRAKFGSMDASDVLMNGFKPELAGRVGTDMYPAQDVITIVAVVLLFLVIIVALFMYMARAE